MLVTNSAELPLPPDEVLRRYRASLDRVAGRWRFGERRLDTEAVLGDWSLQVDLSMIIGLMLRGWRKGLDTDAGATLGSGIAAVGRPRVVVRPRGRGRGAAALAAGPTEVVADRCERGRAPVRRRQVGAARSRRGKSDQRRADGDRDHRAEHEEVARSAAIPRGRPWRRRSGTASTAGGTRHRATASR